MSDKPRLPKWLTNPVSLFKKPRKDLQLSPIMAQPTTKPFKTPEEKKLKEKKLAEIKRALQKLTRERQEIEELKNTLNTTQYFQSFSAPLTPPLEKKPRVPKTTHIQQPNFNLSDDEEDVLTVPMPCSSEDDVDDWTEYFGDQWSKSPAIDNETENVNIVD